MVLHQSSFPATLLHVQLHALRARLAGPAHCRPARPTSASPSPGPCRRSPHYWTRLASTPLHSSTFQGGPPAGAQSSPAGECSTVMGSKCFCGSTPLSFETPVTARILIAKLCECLWVCSRLLNCFQLRLLRTQRERTASFPVLL